MRVGFDQVQVGHLCGDVRQVVAGPGAEADGDAGGLVDQESADAAERTAFSGTAELVVGPRRRTGGRRRPRDR